MAPTTRAAEKAEEFTHESSQLMQGKVPRTEVETGHPLHPATVHWPIAFLTASFGLTTLSLLPVNLYPTSALPPPATLPSLAYYSAAAGTVMALPAIATGVGEAYELTRKEYLQKGSWSAVVDSAWNMKDNGGRKIKMTYKHAAANDMVIALAAYNWYLGYKYPNQALPNFVLALNAIALPALLWSAMIGGRMVYEFGMGVQRQGTGKMMAEKEKEQ